MCGIAGIISKNEKGKEWMQYLEAATNAIASRGPDAQRFFNDDAVAFGHRRLSIIDLSENANQPMADATNRYTIIYNGEIFNFRELKKNLEAAGNIFSTQSDTEVLLQLYAKHGKEMLHLLNGFFVFAIYDRKLKTVFIARDRFGVKPLCCYEDENVFVFASEIKAIMQFPVKKEIDHATLYQYLQLNYIAAPNTIYKLVKKLLPGCSVFIADGKSEMKRWYQLPYAAENAEQAINYEDAQKKLFDLLNNAVESRLIADVPLGSFLSGGIDSSIVSGLAALHTNHLQTFSIGFKEDGFFDETNYARLVAKHFKTEHTVFSLSRNDLLESLDEVLNYFDEPFADSSALPVYILSKQTGKQVTVALSGDGADEIFGGYIKHIGEYRARNQQLPEMMATLFSPAINLFSKSRNSFLGNKFRQAQKFTEGMKMNARDRYWQWCSISGEAEVKNLLVNEVLHSEFAVRKNELTKFIKHENDFNEVLLNDVNLVLPNDMLFKVDSMSMASSLEVRTPFLDYCIVEFAFSLPEKFKVDRHLRKKIVHDAFKNFLPKELYHRKKRGFEIPLHSFLMHELNSLIEENLSPSFLQEQKIFNPLAVEKLKQQLFSNNPGDSAARIWAMLVFQHWWKQWVE